MSDSEFDSGDPWDLISQTPEPVTADDADSEEGTAPTDAADSPPPPPAVATPVPEATDAPPVEVDDDLGEIDMPDLDAGLPEIVNETAGALEVPETESTDLGVPELEMPDLDMAEIESAPIDVADISSDLDLDTIVAEAAEALEVPDAPDFGGVGAEIDDASDAAIEIEDAVPSSRGPLSAMLAGTGLFGDTDETPGGMPTEGDETTEDEADLADTADLGEADDTVEMENVADVADVVEVEDVADVVEIEEVADVADVVEIEEVADVADVVEIEDVAEPVDVPDLEPVLDSPQWAGIDSELPDAQPDWLDGESESDLDIDIDMETGEPPSVYKELEGLAPEAEAHGEADPQPGAESPVDDFAAVYGTDDSGDAGENGFGVTFGDEADVDSEDTTDDDSDDDIARVAAMVADIEPIVAGDVDVEAPEAALSDLDWLDAGEEVEALDGAAESHMPIETTEETSSMSDFSVPEVNFGDQVESSDDAPGTDTDLETLGVAGDHTPDPADASDEPAMSEFDLVESFEDDQPDPFDQTDTSDDTTVSTDGVALDETDSEPTADMMQADPFDAADLSESDGLDGLDGDADDALDLLDLDEGRDFDIPDEGAITEDTVEISTDAETSELFEAAGAATAAVGVGAAVEWGSHWEQSQQGWVNGEWRPIVTTNETLATWSVDVYLGVVVGDTLIQNVTPESLAQARAVAEAAMTNEATARGAHAVVGVNTTVDQVGDKTLVTSSGTAVTLVALDADDGE